ncbi:MAG TPA: AraC family transcriptional regulator [Pyrinomonadaceae bacterium]|nr:AraC family transcriptional regulator [Pyrinomonadaceae bacterium]
MRHADQVADRIYARQPHFQLHLHAGRRIRWSSEARADYSALVLLEGKMRWHSAGTAEKTTVEPRATASTDHSTYAGVEPHTAASAGRDITTGGELVEGSALLSAPGDVLNAASPGFARFLLVALSPVFVLDCATRARLTRSDSVVTFRAPAVAGDARLARLASDLAEELLDEDAGQELVVAALVEQTLVHLLRRHANVRRSEQVELSRAGLVDRRIRLAVELMHAQLSRELSLEEIASAAHLSPFHFARLFKKLTGATPHAYLANLRAARAQTLLAATDLSVTEVGARVGYMSSSHFAKAFRQSTGLSPRAFRKALIRG